MSKPMVKLYKKIVKYEWKKHFIEENSEKINKVYVATWTFGKNWLEYRKIGNTPKVRNQY